MGMRTWSPLDGYTTYRDVLDYLKNHTKNKI